jgi:hypothetical protein
MTRQVTDQLYIELDYYYPEEYYVYVAEAASAQSANVSLSCSAEVIGQTLEAAANLSVTVTQVSLVGRQQNAVIDITAAFTPTLTAEAFKNHTAILEVSTEMLTTAVANRSITMALENIANLNAQSVKTATTSIDLSAAFSQTAQITTTATATSTQSSQAQLTATIGYLKSASSTLTTDSNWNLYLRRLRGTSRPLDILSTSGIDFVDDTYGDDIDPVYGSHFVRMQENATIFSEPTNELTITAGQNFVFEMWIQCFGGGTFQREPYYAGVGVSDDDMRASSLSDRKSVV